MKMMNNLFIPERIREYEIPHKLQMAPLTSGYAPLFHASNLNVNNCFQLWHIYVSLSGLEI